MPSFHIATVNGIPIRVHLTVAVIFFILAQQLGVWGIPAGLLLSGSVLAHELGHALVAQRFGLPIARIDLHLFGGTAMMGAMPDKPRQELLIALAGPLVSLSLGGLGLLLLGGRGLGIAAVDARALLPFFTMVNLGMAIFNMLPALPMDGGRVLRALLSMRMGAVRGTRLAARVARVFALTFVAVGLYLGAWILAGIGVAVFFMAGREVLMVELREQLRRRASLYPLFYQGRDGPYVSPLARPTDPAGPVIDITPR